MLNSRVNGGIKTPTGSDMGGGGAEGTFPDLSHVKTISKLQFNYQ